MAALKASLEAAKKGKPSAETTVNGTSGASKAKGKAVAKDDPEVPEEVAVAF